MRVLAITPIWPNAVEPTRGAFNLQQFKRLSRHCDLTVLSALAYVPGAAHAPARLRPPRVVELAAVPERDTIGGIETHYMRQLYVPKLGVPIAVPLYLASLLPHRELLLRADVLLATWAYPDGCAVTLAARALGKPCVVKVHGTDLNSIAKIPSARAVLKRVLPKVDAMISVSEPLSAELEGLGVAREKVHLVGNGVDKSLFHVRDRQEARRALGVPEGAALVVYVGRLIEAKGIAELLEAMPRVKARVPGATLAVVGDGPMLGRVKEAAAASGGSILAPGARPLADVATWLAASDVFTLPSWMEGMPNVVLEALASGRPVVATRVGGIPDVLPEPDGGYLVAVKDAAGLADALGKALERGRRGEWSAERLSRLGPGSWEESAGSLFRVLEGVVAR